jgi:hypothetical protein
MVPAFAGDTPMKRAWAILLVLLLGHEGAQGQPAAAPTLPRRVQATAFVAVCAVPYCLDLAWQLPLGSRLGWLTTSAANPDPERAAARVFLLRGTGTVLTPGFGDLCARLRRAGMWTEDLGDAGDRWVVGHLVQEQRAGRLRGPIVLIGHSRGGRHAVDAARELHQAGIRVDLLVCLDTTLLPAVPANVRQAVNIFWSKCAANSANNGWLAPTLALSCDRAREDFVAC